MSQAGIISTSSSSPTNVPLVLKGNVVDLQNTSAQLMVVSPAYNFILTSIVMVGSNISGWSAPNNPSIFNIGYTAPNYTDLVTGFQDELAADGLDGANYPIVNFANDNGFPPFIIPPSTSISILVTNAGTTVVNYFEYAYFLGFQAT